MKLPIARVFTLTLALGAVSAAQAQEAVPIEFYRPLKSSFSVGVRMMGAKTKVGFSNLGDIPFRLAAPSHDSGVDRLYENGSVFADLRNVGAVDDPDTPYNPAPTTSGTSPITSSTQLSRQLVAGTNRFLHVRTVTTTDATDPMNPRVTTSPATTLSESAFHRQGSTRGWSFNSASQIGGGGSMIDLSTYSVSPNGATARAESESSPGVELQFSRIMKRYQRFEWGLNFSVAAGDINAKTRQTVRSTLNKLTDTYQLDALDSSNQPANANTLSVPYDSGNDFESVDPNGVPNDGDEYNRFFTKYLRYQAITSNVLTHSDTDVFGFWQIKGAYYLFRAGPVIRFPFLKKWSVSAGVGLAGAYVGTKFRFDEYIILPDVNDLIRFRGESSEKAFVTGYYADVNIERWFTIRTGVFAGYSYEKLGDFSQSVGRRQADVDLGSGTGFRFGIMTRF
jgi:hypothetical protein